MAFNDGRSAGPQFLNSAQSGAPSASPSFYNLPNSSQGVHYDTTPLSGAGPSTFSAGRDYIQSKEDFNPQNPFRDPPERTRWIKTRRGLIILGLAVLLIVIILLLAVFLPIYLKFIRSQSSSSNTTGSLSVGPNGHLVTSSSIPSTTRTGSTGLIDPDTPKSAQTRASATNPSQTLQLVWSDEFNVDGRTFYPGDDPFWEAVDLQYWETGDLEWYNQDAVTTKNGSLVITLEQKENHNLLYSSGMVSTWNKFCFTGGLIETSVSLPGANNIVGLWPAVWTMGNLGRAGYGASLEGMWPYTYDACDVGTMPNQTLNGQPAAALSNGDAANGGILSFLPGQKLSRCTCAGESHPGPKHPDGSFVGRSAPEIDMFEATVGGNPIQGRVSQSLQAAPFNFNYTYPTGASDVSFYNGSELNPEYKGGVFQQAMSALTFTDQNAYELNGGGFSTYGFEYKPGFDNAFITWLSSGVASWTLHSSALAADPQVEISARPVPQEPMYILANLGLSPNFGTPDFQHLTFPATMRIDYVRVYQPADAINIGCDPKDFPTADYINQYMEAYTNPNLTTWRDDFKQPFPKNSLAGQC